MVTAIQRDTKRQLSHTSEKLSRTLKVDFSVAANTTDTTGNSYDNNGVKSSQTQHLRAVHTTFEGNFMSPSSRKSWESPRFQFADFHLPPTHAIHHLGWRAVRPFLTTSRPRTLQPMYHHQRLISADHVDGLDYSCNASRRFALMLCSPTAFENGCSKYVTWYSTQASDLSSKIDKSL